MPGILRRDAPTHSESNADLAVSAAAGGIMSSESVETSPPSPSHSLISDGFVRVPSPLTTRNLGPPLMLTGGGSSSFPQDDGFPNLSSTVSLRENENGSGEPSESRQSLLTSGGELSDLAHFMDQISLGAGGDTRPLLPSGVEPLDRICFTGVDRIYSKWIDASEASRNQVSHQQQAFSEWRHNTTNYDDDHDDDVERADGADEKQVLSDHLSRTNFTSDEIQVLSDHLSRTTLGSDEIQVLCDQLSRANFGSDEMQVWSDQLSRTNFDSDQFVIIRDVNNEDGETTDSSLTSMVDSESESGESEDGNGSDDGADNYNSHDNHDSSDTLIGPDNQDPDDEADEDWFHGPACVWQQTGEVGDSEHENDEDDEDDEDGEDDKNHQNEESISADVYKMFYHGVANLFNTLGPSCSTQ